MNQNPNSQRDAALDTYDEEAWIVSLMSAVNHDLREAAEKDLRFMLKRARQSGPADEHQHAIDEAECTNYAMRASSSTPYRPANYPGDPTPPASRSENPSRRQIIFNWMMGEADFKTKSDGYWGGKVEVEDIDALLSALDAVSERGRNEALIEELRAQARNAYNRPSDGAEKHHWDTYWHSVHITAEWRAADALSAERKGDGNG